MPPRPPRLSARGQLRQGRLRRRCAAGPTARSWTQPALSHGNGQLRGESSHGVSSARSANGVRTRKAQVSNPLTPAHSSGMKTSPLPPGDFHPQAIAHAGRTQQRRCCAAPLPGSRAGLSLRTHARRTPGHGAPRCLVRDPPRLAASLPCDRLRQPLVPVDRSQGCITHHCRALHPRRPDPS